MKGVGCQPWSCLFEGVTCLRVVSSECSPLETMKSGMKALGRILSLLALALLAGPPAAGAETAPVAVPPDARNATLPGLIREAEKGVFFIRVMDAGGKPIAMGTGFLANKTGAVVTSLHLICPPMGCAAAVEAVAADGKVCAVKGVTQSDESLDLAVLQLAEVPPDAVPIALAGNELPERGSYVLVLGHPMEFRFVSTDGIVSAVNKTRDLPASFRDSDCIHTAPDVVWLQTSAAVAMGNSGGPMLDASGKAIGVIQWMARGPGMNFALHIAPVRELLERPAALVSVEDFARPEAELNQFVSKFQTDYYQYIQQNQQIRQRQLMDRPAPQENEPPPAPVHPGVAGFPKLLELAAANRGKSVEYRALDVLMRIACTRDFPPDLSADVRKVADQLLTEFRDDRRLLALLRCRPVPTLPEARGFLRALAEKSQDSGIRALAALSLACALDADTDTVGSRDEAIKFARLAAACPPDITFGREMVAAMANELVAKLTVSSVGCPAPALAGKDRKGEELALGDYLGRYVVVAFWNKKGDFFDMVTSTLDELERKYTDVPLSLVGVGLYDTMYSTRSSTKATKSAWRFIADGSDEALKKAWHVTTQPTLFLLDPKGVIIGRFSDPIQTNMTIGNGSVFGSSYTADSWKTALTRALMNLPDLSEKMLLRMVTSEPWLLPGIWDPSGSGARTVFLRANGLTSVKWISNWKIKPPSGLHLELPGIGGVDLEFNPERGEARVKAPESLASRTMRLRAFHAESNEETKDAARLRGHLLAATWDWFDNGKPELERPQMQIRFLADGTTSVPELPAWEILPYGQLRIYRDDGCHWTFRVDLTSMCARSIPNESQIKEDRSFAADSRHKTKDGSRIQTSLTGVMWEHYPEFAFDGRQDTFFWANRGLQVDDHLTLYLKKALEVETPVEVVTGGTASYNGDRLGAGVLEASADDTTWTKLADFADGKAAGNAPAGTRQLRVRVTEAQGFYLIIHEISVGKK